MGERGPISGRIAAAVAVIALTALAAPASVGAHAAYVDAEGDGTPSIQCADPADPCQTIAEAAPFVEDGLAVYIDDSPTPYTEQVIAQGVAGADDIAFIELDFRGGDEGQVVIDGGTGTAITVPAGRGATIDEFTLRGDDGAVSVAGRATISNSVFDDPAAAPDVEVTGPGPNLIANNIFTDAGTPADTAVSLANGSGQTTLGRNTIRGYGTGVLVGDVTGAVTMNSDVLAGNVEALDMIDDVIVRNATFWDNSGTDITSTGADLTLDSSILEQEIDADGTSTCDIAFSRGPTVAPQADPCDAFQTDDQPMFVNPPADLRLLTGSPMIDAGNPASANNFRDIEGDPRALDGNGDGACPVELDIGADEFAGVPLDCNPPTPLPTPPAQPPADTTPPQTLIDSGPSSKTKSTSASFTFSSSEAGSTFECSLDGAAFASCTSPHAVKVKKGSHVLDVRARDAAGNVDSSPASHRWTVKKKKKKRK